MQHGIPLFAPKKLGGWKTLEIVRKYAHLGNEHLVKYANASRFWHVLIRKQKTPPKLVAFSN